MQIELHEVNGTKIAEVTAADLVITSVEDGIDLVGNLYYGDFDRVIVHEQNITPDFFDLKTGIAGEILQKFSNYRIRLAIVGDFSKYQSKSLRDFIYESNSRQQINFVDCVPDAVSRLSV